MTSSYPESFSSGFPSVPMNLQYWQPPVVQESNTGLYIGIGIFILAVIGIGAYFLLKSDKPQDEEAPPGGFAVMGNDLPQTDAEKKIDAEIAAMIKEASNDLEVKAAVNY